MSDSYDWGAPQQPTQPEKQPATSGPAGFAGPAGSDKPKPAGGSGLGKKIGIGAIAVVAVAALGVGGFQVFKASQGADPNPIGITDEVAQDLVRHEFDDCMLTPELIEASGIKDLKQMEDYGDGNYCQGYLDGPGGVNKVPVQIRVEQSSSGDASRSDVEGWKEYEYVSDEDDVNADFKQIVESWDAYSDAYYDQPDRYCRLEGDERELEKVHLVGPTCESVTPLANQLMNVVKQDIYLNTKAGFFEIKDKPEYVETQPAGSVDTVVPGFREAYDNAPELGTEFDNAQGDFDGSKFKITDVYADPEDYWDVCIDGVFTLGTKEERGNSTFYLPQVKLVGSDGQVIDTSSDYDYNRLEEGESMDIRYCGDYYSSQTLPATNVEFVIVGSEKDGSDTVFTRDGEPIVLGTWSQAQDDTIKSDGESDSESA